MKRTIFLISAILLATAVYGQESTFTGTVITYGSGFSTRTRTQTFTLRIKRTTSDSEATRLVGILQERGQDKLLDEIRHNDLGSFSIGGNLGRTINAIRIEDIDGKKRIRAVGERWLGLGELRGGYRSLDYPFSYIELVIDPRTGKGEGSYFGAAQIRFKNGDVQIEDFGTFPGRLLNVRMTGHPLP
jgi:hypothetical protein